MSCFDSASRNSGHTTTKRKRSTVNKPTNNPLPNNNNNNRNSRGELKTLNNKQHGIVIYTNLSVAGTSLDGGSLSSKAKDLHTKTVVCADSSLSV